jgi:NAD(P)-dependent dehydrogenase (short-subunit alcohol dehydrogenase family)
LYINGQEVGLMQMETEHAQPLNGRVAVITGAGCGLGRRLAHAFADAGAVIAATDQTPGGLMDIVQDIQIQNQAIKGYLTKPGQVTALVEEILQEWGRIDILVNIPTLPDRVYLQDLSDREWQVILEQNLSAPFYFMRAASTSMALQAEGVILNFTAAEKLGPFEDGMGAYFACNSAMISMTRTAARELDGDNIRVHAICTGDLALFAGNVDTFDMLVSDEMSNGIAKLAVYLSSLDASHLTGQVIQINRADEP